MLFSSQKLVSIFNLSTRLLSQQQHYDWGLRALKTVLKGCGGMLKMSKRSGDESKQKITNQREAELVVQALRLNTLSKLTFSDSMRFDSLVKDVFTGVKFEDEGYVELKAALQVALVHPAAVVAPLVAVECTNRIPSFIEQLMRLIPGK